jgi:hypothetical protein
MSNSISTMSNRYHNLIAVLLEIPVWSQCFLFVCDMEFQISRRAFETNTDGPNSSILRRSYVRACECDDRVEFAMLPVDCIIDIITSALM